ncbi:MAG: hypothetical protein M1824_003923 [Vezdaea acicularis]|nr:MAG: hypothetical protein M1824_003923 [Vezdaea acicularis]
MVRRVNEDLAAAEPTAPLPAYSENDEHSGRESPFEVVNPEMAFTSAQPQTYLSAEEEKAALRDSAMGDSPAPHPIDRSAPALDEQEPIAPTSTSPGQATESTLHRGLQVASSNGLVSSGFAYPSVLASYGVTPAEWSRFTSEITEPARLTSGDWTIAIGGGVGTFVVAGIFIGWLGVIPAYLVGRHLQRKKEVGNINKARVFGDLEDKLYAWNKDFFAPRGLLIRLDLPGESLGDMYHMDVMSGRGACSVRGPGSCRQCGSDPNGEKAQKWQAKIEKCNEKIARKMDKLEKKQAYMEAKMATKPEWVQKKVAGKMELKKECAERMLERKQSWLEKKQEKISGWETRKAAKRGRIVILPINKGPNAEAQDLSAFERVERGAVFNEKELYEDSVAASQTGPFHGDDKTV